MFILGFGIYWARGLSKYSVKQEYDQLFNTKDSIQFDLSKPGEFSWAIAANDWDYRGECRLALVVSREFLTKHERPTGPTGLRIFVDVNAVSSQIESGEPNRKVQNSYFQNRGPQHLGGGLWVSYGFEEIEYGIAGFQRYAVEDTLIRIDVLDPAQSEGVNAYLRVSTDADYALGGHAPWFFRMVDLASIICSTAMICLGVLAFFRPKPKKGV